MEYGPHNADSVLGRKYLEWTMPQHIPKEEKQYAK